MLVNHGPSQQCSKEEYKPWKWGATASYYTSHAKTMLPTRKSVQQVIGPHEDLLTIVKRHKLQWYGHVSRSLGLAKAIFQGAEKGGRRRGRHGKRWEDNIRELTGLEFAKSQRAVKNREKWGKLVAKSSVVPQWPSKLRDRWWWWWWWIVQLEERQTRDRKLAGSIPGGISPDVLTPVWLTGLKALTY